MSAESVIRRYVDDFNRGDVVALASHYAVTTQYTQPFLSQPATTPAEVEAFESGMFAGFSDVHVDLEWLVGAGSEAAAGMTVTAVHTAPMGLPDGSQIPATGNRIELRTVEHVVVDGDDRIVHHERYADPGAFVAQLTGQASPI